MSSEDSRVSGAVRGDREATASLLTDLLPRMRNLVRYFVRGDDIDDIVQDGLMAVLRGLPTYRGDGSITAWCDRVVARVAMEASRRRRAETSRTASDVEVAAPERADDYLARRRLVACLDTLSQEMRETLVLHHVFEMSAPEVATELGVPLETVRSRLRNGRARLREHLGEPAAAVGEGRA